MMTLPKPDIRCLICRKLRPWDFISVKVNQLDECCSENIQYCNDDKDCTESSKTFTHFPNGLHAPVPQLVRGLPESVGDKGRSRWFNFRARF